MCGIAAVWGAAEDIDLSGVIAKQQHRGPDGVGFAQTDPQQTSLGHCRLAIIDPKQGRQPLHDPSSGASLVANGMIYNDLAIRQQNESWQYQTHSDSESILHSVVQRGADAVGDLDGMFAFVLADQGHVIAARDPIGIKPLYMGEMSGGVVFASEIKALVGVAENIREFPAGHIFDSASGFTRYYALPHDVPAAWDLDDATARLRETLERAVVKRLRSDVPFGALLSGGLDSSIIAALAKQHVPDLKTFAVGLPGSVDLAAARVVADYLGTDHRELMVAPDDVARVIPDVLYHLESYDQDLVRSAIPCWFVAEFAAREVKVVLTGEGADELFAGYTYYRDIEDADALHRELRRSIESMHNVNLQRVDRMTMAHGLEARVPFLDTTMIDLGLSLPIEWKLRQSGDRQIEKWILRKAFEDLLPHEIVWRDKLQFDQGSGFSDLLSAAAANNGNVRLEGSGARSDEEAFYEKLLTERYEQPDPVLGLVAHWADRPAA